MEVAGGPAEDAGKRLAAVHRAIRIREKWMSPPAGVAAHGLGGARTA